MLQQVPWAKALWLCAVLEQIFALTKALLVFISLLWVFWEETSHQKGCPSQNWYVFCTFFLSTWLTQYGKWWNSLPWLLRMHCVLLASCLQCLNEAHCTESKFTVMWDAALTVCVPRKHSLPTFCVVFAGTPWSGPAPGESGEGKGGDGTYFSFAG